MSGVIKNRFQTIGIIAMVPEVGNIRDLPEEYYSIRNYNTAFKRMNSRTT